MKNENTPQINNYTKIFEKYIKTELKPDKKYSMLHTTISYLNLNNSDTVLDIGCGSGYFTIPFGYIAKKVIGIDNNATQIKSANNIKQDMNIKNIDYFIEDMNTYKYPENYFSCINAPFVLNYSKTLIEMKNLFQKRYNSLQKGGKLFAIMDNPCDIIHNNKKFGSIKRFPGKQMVDGAMVEMMLYNGDEYLCTLYSYFYSKITIEKLLKEIGFTDIQRKNPLISLEGMEKEGGEFRSEYIQNCDIMYLYAKK